MGGTIVDILKKINKLRIDRGWSIYRLSEEADLPQSTITNMFNRGTLPSLNTLESICSAFGLSLSEFFSDEDQNDEIGYTKEQVSELYDALLPSNKKLVLELIKALLDNK